MVRMEELFNYLSLGTCLGLEMSILKPFSDKTSSQPFYY